MEKITKKDIILIVISIIAAWVLTPVLTFLGRLVVDSTTATGNWLTNIIFLWSARTTDVSKDIILLILYILTLYLFFWFYPQIEKRIDHSRSEYDEFKKEYDAFEKKTTEDDLKLKLLNDNYSSAKEFRSTIISVFIAAMLSLFISSFFKTNTRGYYTKFNKDIEIIAPYVSDQQLKIYKSQWRLMKTKADYEKIYKGIDSTFKANKIKK